MKNKKLDVHMVQHTHWDREWYFTSDDSRTMLYYDMKYLIEHLEKHDDKFTFDGQSSVIDDFLKFSPEWKERFANVVKKRKLLVGPFYTQTDNVLPNGESIVRNIEIGDKLAEDLGHSMKVGYLPDTFGHNNQSPQILKMTGINNISFYRGLDPVETDDKLYFKYKGLDGSEILGHWQTHYSTDGNAFEYTTKAFDEHVVADYKKPGEFKPSVKSYAKRNFGLPITIPVGTDQRPFRKEVVKILKDLNSKYKEFNFIASDYETAINEVIKEIKEKKISLPVVTGELRQALTGRVHRSVISSRMDIKQLNFKLESILIDVLEPLSIMCKLNDVDVPWKMIEHVWKELFKSSAHDSYGTTNEDIVNAKLKNRLLNATRVAECLIAMLTRIFSSKIINEEKDSYEKLVLFNFDSKKYSGLYQFTTTVKRGFEEGKFKFFDNKKEVKYSILKRNNLGTHEVDALTLLINAENIPAFSYKILKIKYLNKSNYEITKANIIKNKNISIKVNKKSIEIKKSNKIYKNLFTIAMDPSVGDTYDHSPITFNDKKYALNNYKIIETCKKSKTIKFEASAIVPSGISNWKVNLPTNVQKVTIQLSIISDKIHAKIITKNSTLDGRMIIMVDSLSKSDRWKHDQQFGIYERNLRNKYMYSWEKPNKFGYKWDEYPTNLSPHQSFITNNENNFTIYTQGTREHELIEYKKKKVFAITLYRAIGVFGRAGTAYRPGRWSGAATTAPDCQMLNDVLEYDFLFDFGKKTKFEQFNISKQLSYKTYYVPKQWGLDRTILRWDTNIDYYQKDNKRKIAFNTPKELVNKKFVLTSIYQTPKGKTIARYLNLGKEVKINFTSVKASRLLKNYKKGLIKISKYGLINIIVGGSE